ncbi:MAG: translation initiation factor IF-2 subunit beta [Methanobacteriota archaeon]|nr:MAG: translation initiation factor IF-2 subunit beta [Euryarchaeota archaeon]
MGSGYEYEKLLDRAITALPPKIFEKRRFELPEVKLLIQGNQTVIQNLRSVANAISRDPDHLAKYLLREMATAGRVDGQRLIFQGRFTREVVEERLKRYVEEYVLCHECKKPDTKIVKEGRYHLLKCEACGARSSIRHM